MGTDDGYRERFDQVLKEKELIAVRRWDGNNGWGRTTMNERRWFAAIMVIWLLVVIVFGFYKIFAG